MREVNRFTGTKTFTDRKYHVGSASTLRLSVSSEQRCSARPVRSAAMKANKALDTRSQIVEYHRTPEDLYGLQLTR